MDEKKEIIEEAAPVEAVHESPAEQAAPAAGKIRRAERKLTAFQSFLLQALIFFTVVYVLFTFIVGVMIAPNEDMYPRIDGGDLLLYYRLQDEYKAQNIIVFNTLNTRYVGRIIAAPGDTVEITPEGSVVINGSGMLEHNIFYPVYPLEGFTEYPLTLGEDEFFVLADHRQGCEDSRFFGPVHQDQIQGLVITVMRRNNL